MLLNIVADSDYRTMTFQVLFQPMGSVMQICRNVRIIDDEISNEPDEQFSVSLVNANPIGVFSVSESCITITDNDGKWDNNF